MQRQQARLDRTFFRLLDELDRLTPADDDEVWRNKLGGGATAPAGPANDDAEGQNEPNELTAAAVVATAAAPAAAGALPHAPAPEGAQAERAAAERLLAEGRVKPVNDLLRAMLAQGSGGPG